jgi:hypothetical protein
MANLNIIYDEPKFHRKDLLFTWLMLTKMSSNQGVSKHWYVLGIIPY